MAALSMEEFYARRLRSALMFAERALADVAMCGLADDDEPNLASALGHLRVACHDLKNAVDGVSP